MLSPSSLPSLFLHLAPCRIQSLPTRRPQRFVVIAISIRREGGEGHWTREKSDDTRGRMRHSWRTRTRPLPATAFSRSQPTQLPCDATSPSNNTSTTPSTHISRAGWTAIQLSLSSFLFSAPLLRSPHRCASHGRNCSSDALAWRWTCTEEGTESGKHVAIRSRHLATLRMYATLLRSRRDLRGDRQRTHLCLGIGEFPLPPCLIGRAIQ